jgi:subtilase family serine protease
MRSPMTILAAAALLTALVAPAAPAAVSAAGPMLVPLAIEAPGAQATATTTLAACTTPGPVVHYTWYHCYAPSEIVAAYKLADVQKASNYGLGQTIVLVDAYGSPTAAQDLQAFHEAFYPDFADPNFDQVFPQGKPDYHNTAHGNGQSGPSAAAGWAGEATLDIEWAYAIAPLAHIVLLAVPPAETEGVQGFPNLFNAMQWAVDNYPAGTVFSQSFGVTEQTFGGAAAVQSARFDAVYQAGNAKGDTFLASSGDNGTTGVAKQQKDGRVYSFPTTGWPASSPYVTAVGGTQLQSGWTWDPTSDTPFLSNGSPNPDYFAYSIGGNTEVVWNESWLPSATGGGPSAIYPMPTWQLPVKSVIGTNARGVPDLSWNAAVNGGVLVYTSFYPNASRVGWHIYGGTSAASPQVAGLIALANAQQKTAGKSPIGDVAPLLYSSSMTASDFTDIVPVTEGTAASGVLADNTLWQYNADGSVSAGPVAGHPVLSGWDMATGFGSPIGVPFVADLIAARNAP